MSSARPSSNMLYGRRSTSCLAVLKTYYATQVVAVQDVIAVDPRILQRSAVPSRLVARSFPERFVGFLNTKLSRCVRQDVHPHLQVTHDDNLSSLHLLEGVVRHESAGNVSRSSFSNVNLLAVQPGLTLFPAPRISFTQPCSRGELPRHFNPYG